jgi:hypothetical protein
MENVTSIKISDKPLVSDTQLEMFRWLGAQCHFRAGENLIHDVMIVGDVVDAHPTMTPDEIRDQLQAYMKRCGLRPKDAKRIAQLAYQWQDYRHAKRIAQLAYPRPVGKGQEGIE